MASKLIVTSKSNVKYLDSHPILSTYFYSDDDVLIIDRPPSTWNCKGFHGAVFALGGGSVIDTAKMINRNKPCYAIPTNASGSAMTSWAVVWQKKRKISVECRKPILLDLFKNLNIQMPAKAKENTCYDCLGHIIDSSSNMNLTYESAFLCLMARTFLNRFLGSANMTDLIIAGNYAGSAIEITGTGYIHALSYILTLEHGLPHGEAVKEAILMRNKFNWNKIIKKARNYGKFHNRYKKI